MSKEPAMDLEKNLKLKFTCAKCRHKSATTKRFAAPGTGISRFLDLQHNRFLAVVCNHCGHVDLFDLKVLEGKGDMAMNILDVIFDS